MSTTGKCFTYRCLSNSSLIFVLNTPTGIVNEYIFWISGAWSRISNSTPHSPPRPLFHRPVPRPVQLRIFGRQGETYSAEPLAVALYDPPLRIIPIDGYSTSSASNSPNVTRAGGLTLARPLREICRIDNHRVQWSVLYGKEGQFTNVVARNRELITMSRGRLVS